MKPRTLILLALLVIGLGAFVWFGRELPSTDELTQRAKRVLPLEADDVREMEIEWGPNLVRLTRQATEAGEAEAPPTWAVSAPIEARADATRVEGLLRRVVALEKERTLEDVDREAVGLATPRGRVRLITDEGDRVLEVGAEIPASSNMTLAVAGEPGVHVVAGAIWSDLTVEPSEWRDRQLFNGQRGSISRIALDSEAGSVVLAREGDEFWVEGAVRDLADETLVNALLSTITGLRAERFVGDAATSETGLEAPAATIAVTLSAAEPPLTLELGGRESDAEEAARYARVNGELVTLKADFDDSLGRSAESWRSKDLVAGEVYALARVEIETAGGRTELSRVEGEWLRDGEPVAYGVVTDLLYDLSGGSASRVVEGASVGELGAPRLTFRLVGEADEAAAAPVEELIIFAPVGEESPARNSGRDTVLMLAAESVQQLEEKLVALRAAPVERPEEEAAATDEESGG